MNCSCFVSTFTEKALYLVSQLFILPTGSISSFKGMNVITTFDISKEALLDLLRGIEDGKIQLPDFQRDWVWEDAKVRSLLSSVSLAYPIGVVMLLQLGNPHMRLKPRLLSGVSRSDLPAPTLLILDGQQRLTTLFQALRSGRPVITRERGFQRTMERWYYIDIHRALTEADTEREVAILGFGPDRVWRSSHHILIDCSTPEREYELDLFPLANVFEYADWRSKYSKFWNYRADKLELLDRFEGQIIKAFEHYQVPLIELRPELPKEAVCQVFEKVNSTGKQLTFFDLLTAAYAADDFSLREDWATREARLHQKPVLSTISATDFLQAISLMALHARRREGTISEESGKVPVTNYSRHRVLQLTLAEYQRWTDPITRGFEDAARFLHGQKIFDARDIPYPMQLVALVAILTSLGDLATQDPVRTKLSQWYWCGVFGELYPGSVVARAARDLVEVVGWARGGVKPTTVMEAMFAPSRLLRLCHRQSAAYRGLCTLLLQQGALDFCTGEAVTDVRYFNDRIDSHHIFPKAWCRRFLRSEQPWNCIVNKTLLSAKTNQEIGSHPPCLYLAKLEHKGIPSERLDEILRSHLIEPETLRRDDFEAFFQARMQALLMLIGQAMGKPLSDPLHPVDWLQHA
jgi:hypothetical protein